MADTVTLKRPLDGLRQRAARAALQTRGRAASLWRAYPRETLGVGLLGTVAAATIGASVLQAPAHNTPTAAPPAPPPLVLRQVAPEEALKLNAEIPVASGPNPAAQPFAFKGNTATRAQALECLSSAVYYEAGSQDDDGQRAVAQVVLNRVRNVAFPSSVCSVLMVKG